MTTDRLTNKQIKLIKELEEIAYHLSLDFYKIHNYRRKTRTTYLELARDKVIRGQVINVHS